MTSYARFLTKKALARKPSAIRALMPFLKEPGMISLGAGLPNPATFPFTSLTMGITNPGNPAAPPTQVSLSEEELNSALQYSATPGLPPLLDHLSSITAFYHGANASQCGTDRSLAVTNGSQDGLTKAFDMLFDPGDSLLIELPSYSGALAALQPAGVNLVEVPVDSDGLDVDVLAGILNDWPHEVAKPKALYTIVTGQNPSGVTLDAGRKEAIYSLACQHDFLILEDDPYYFLTHPGTEPQPSFLTMDAESRVLRFDSMSKILSSGLRLGWVTGPEPLINTIVLAGQATNLHPSGVSQALAVSLLDTWGVQGFDAHVQSTRAFYGERAKIALAAAEKHLAGLARWTVPTAGMFMWLELVGFDDTFSLIKEKALEAKVLLVPGSAFSPNGEPSSFVRASFSLATPEDIDTAFGRLANLIKDNQPASATSH